MQNLGNVYVCGLDLVFKEISYLKVEAGESISV
jgi:hypothetical protein